MSLTVERVSTLYYNTEPCRTMRFGIREQEQAERLFTDAWQRPVEAPPFFHRVCTTTVVANAEGTCCVVTDFPSYIKTQKKISKDGTLCMYDED